MEPKLSRSNGHVLETLRYYPKSQPEWTLWQIRDFILGKFGVMYSESGVSARLRDLRKAGYRIEKRLKEKGSRTYLYRLEP